MKLRKPKRCMEFNFDKAWKKNKWILGYGTTVMFYTLNELRRIHKWLGSVIWWIEVTHGGAK